jgi:NADP-dependent 3-hydroxy acid dehydrogenase YdfG
LTRRSKDDTEHDTIHDPLNTIEMKGKLVLITGGAVGIGFCTATEFAKAGSRLILTDVNEEKLDEAAQKLREQGAEVYTYVNNVTDRAAVKKLARDVLAKFGELDVLINNAGVGLTKELKDTTYDDWEKLVNVNLWGPLHFIYAFLPSMIEHRSGHIVNISSGQAFYRLPTWGAYASIKLALGGISEVFYYELAEYGIKVTTVYPYMVNTGFYSDVKAETFGTKMAMKFLPYYAQSAEKVAKIIFKAVKKDKQTELVTLMNIPGYFSQVMPLTKRTISVMSNLFLAKHEK